MIIRGSYIKILIFTFLIIFLTNIVSAELESCNAPGDKRCFNGNVETCSYLSGIWRWIITDDCGNDGCLFNECIVSCTDECNPNEKECTTNYFGDEGYKTCQLKENGCYEWSSLNHCYLGQECLNGVCTYIPCSNECNEGERVCNGDGYKVCENVDQDLCFEWSNTVDCFSDETCQNGYCEEAYTGCEYNNPSCSSGYKCVENECIYENYQCEIGQTKACDMSVELHGFMVSMPGLQWCRNYEWQECEIYEEITDEGYYANPYCEGETLCYDFHGYDGVLYKCEKKKETNNCQSGEIVALSGFHCPVGYIPTCIDNMMRCLEDGGNSFHPTKMLDCNGLGGCYAGDADCRYASARTPTPNPLPFPDPTIQTVTNQLYSLVGSISLTYLLYKGAAWAGCGILIFDDATGIGVADDPLIPFVCGAAVLSYHTGNATYSIPLEFEVGNISQEFNLTYSTSKGKISESYILKSDSFSDILCNYNLLKDTSICVSGNYTFETAMFNDLQSSFNLLWNSETNESYYTICENSEDLTESNCILTNELAHTKINVDYDSKDYVNVQRIINPKLRLKAKHYANQIINKTIDKFSINSTSTDPLVNIKFNGMETESEMSDYFKGSVMGDSIYIIPTNEMDDILNNYQDINQDADNELKLILAHEIAHLAGTVHDGVADWYAEDIWEDQAPSHEEFQEFINIDNSLINQIPNCENIEFDPLNSNENGTFYCTTEIDDEEVLIARGATVDFLNWVNNINPDLIDNKSSLYDITSNLQDQDKYNWYVMKWKRVYDYDNLAGDVNFDGSTNILDLSRLGLTYDTIKGEQKFDLFNDINNDGKINIIDLSLLGQSYGR
ncbi:dockerin type I repeat-containing protein [Nanoarchaeota archaeon]